MMLYTRAIWSRHPSPLGRKNLLGRTCDPCAREPRQAMPGLQLGCLNSYLTLTSWIEPRTSDYKLLQAPKPSHYDPYCEFSSDSGTYSLNYCEWPPQGLGTFWTLLAKTVTYMWLSYWTYPRNPVIATKCDFKGQNYISWYETSSIMLKRYKFTCLYVYVVIGCWSRSSKIWLSCSNLENASLIWFFLLSLRSLINMGDAYMVYKPFRELSYLLFPPIFLSFCF